MIALIEPSSHRRQGFSALHRLQNVDNHASAGARTLVVPVDDFSTTEVDGRNLLLNDDDTRALLWRIMVHYGALWCVMWIMKLHRVAPRRVRVMVRYGAPWCIMVHYGTSWCIMVHYGASWCLMVRYGGYGALWCLWLA